MALPSTITTNLYPDFKGAIIGPFPRVALDIQNVSTGTGGMPFGFSTSLQEVAQSFKPTTSGPVSAVDIYLRVQGSPSDSVQLTLYSDGAGQPGTLLATAKLLPAAGIGALSYRRLVFPSPAIVTSGVTYWLRLARTGALSTSNYYQWGVDDAASYADGKLQTMDSTGIWSDVSPDARFKVRVSLPGRYVFAVDKSANKVRCYKSTDNETWTEQDSANAPAVSSTTSLKSFYALSFDSRVSVFIITSATRLDIFNYNVATDAWGSSAFNATAAFNVSHVSGVAAMIGGFRSPDYPASTIPLSDYLFANNGATETVMGNPRRRIKLSRRLISDGTWNTPYDVVGSGFTPDATLPGVAVDYDLRAAFVDMLGHFHIFWTQSDDSNIHHRDFNYNNAFGNANLLGSTPATTSNTAAYPMGQPVNFFRGGLWRIAVSYVDSGALKLAKDNAGAANSAPTWTLVTIATATIETTASNPAVLVSDNENGGKLFAFFVKSDGKLYVTNDGGTDTWVEPQEFRPGTKTVAGLSAQALSDAIALAYQDNSPTPDVVKYDQAEVFF